MMELDKFIASYSCRFCGAERCVGVRYREPGEDLIVWLDGVLRPAVHLDHKSLGGSCPSQQCDLKLPLPVGADGVGCRVKQ